MEPIQTITPGEAETSTGLNPEMFRQSTGRQSSGEEPLPKRSRILTGMPAPVPFGELLMPIVQEAAKQLRGGVLSVSARESLERSLLKRLSLHAAPILLREMDARRLPGERLALQWLGAGQSSRTTAAYERFVSDLLEDRLSAFFTRWPVLAKAIGTIVEFWIEATNEFLTRFSNDFPGEQIADLDAAQSDPHHRGRTVVLLPGRVYKPRNVAAEAALHDFLVWCNCHNAPAKLISPKVACRDGYGWVERITPVPLSSPEAAERYYHRAGALLAVLHILGTTDAHHENMTAWGEYPVLIDAETVLTPTTALSNPKSVSPAGQRLDRSVMRTGMLPSSHLGYDVSALGDASGDMPTVPKWTDVNTDSMRRIGVPAELIADNLPTLNGIGVPARPYLGQILQGFREMSAWLLANKTELPLHLFSAVQTRFIFRPTAIYGMILHSAMRPESLTRGVDGRLQLELLERYFVQSNSPAEIVPILEAERQALERLDVPLFSVHATETALRCGHTAIPNFFERSGFDELDARVHNLSAEDVEEEARIIEASFTTSIPHSSRTPDEIAEHLAQSAVQSGEDVDWYGLVFNGQSGQFTLSPTGPNLYDGGAGTALFLDAIDKVRGTSKYRDLVVRAMKTAARQALAEPQMPLGGATGLASVVYALAKVGLLELARKVAARITPERIAADQEFDLLSGAAGVIPAMLEIGDIDKARLAADHLVAAKPRRLTGFSHGAAGIAYALLRIGYKEAAEDLIAWEDFHYSEPHQNWADLRNPSKTGYRTTWCHGAPGIGLARLQTLDQLDTPEIRRDIEAALATTRANCDTTLDHIFCGVFGRIETLIEAGLLDEARGHAQRALDRGLFVGHNALNFAPGFYRGLAGIGYQMLRLEDPTKLPSVLAWR